MLRTKQDACRLKTWRYPSVVAAMWLCCAAPHYLSSCNAQVAASQPRFEIATTDANTRWGFRTISPVTVNSPIIRLEDVVQPLDPSMAGWQRLRRSLIGLVPIDGRPMTIRRDRLAEKIHGAEATPLSIDWIGPSEIKVLYRKADEAEMQRQRSGSAAIAQTAHAQTSASPKPQSSNFAGGLIPLSEGEAKRAIYWIELAMKRLLPSIAENYRIEVDRRQRGLSPLRGISGVTTIDPRGKIHEGRCRFHVIGRSVDGEVETEIDITLTAHPRVVVPRRSLPRGHQIEPNDLELKPIPEEQLDSGYAVDPDELIGLEVRHIVHVNRPINRGDVGSPILVHRGDLIEIRVVGGGISVTTNAKSLGDGAVSELIEIETLQPRKRLLARVVKPGMVEIVTRAPKVTR